MSLFAYESSKQRVRGNVLTYYSVSLVAIATGHSIGRILPPRPKSWLAATLARFTCDSLALSSSWAWQWVPSNTTSDFKFANTQLDILIIASPLQR